MTKREIFKILKQEKLFSRFCVVIANSFWDTSTPKTYRDKYIAVGVTNKEDIIATVKTWKTNRYCDTHTLRIQQ